MKTLIILIVLVFSNNLKAEETILKISSFNIHYIVPGRDKMDWDRRKNAVSSILKDIDADIIAFQEMETFEGKHYSGRNIQADWIIETLPDYSIASYGDPEIYPITQPVFYRKDKFSVIEQGFFFFSDTPEVIYSWQWNGGYPYFCTWVRFMDTKNSIEFTVFNIHNDYKSFSNRLKTSKLIASRVSPLLNRGENVVITGDFNASYNSKTINILKESGLKISKPSGSTNHFNIGLNILPAIDHILVSEGIGFIDGIKVWRNKYDGVWPSDHYPISTRLTIKNSISE